MLLALTCGLRFRGLDHDLAYDITSYSGTFITDEGWYNKSARSLALWGEWRHEMDRNIYSHTPLFALWMAGVFEVFGVSLEVARAASVASFFASLWLFYLICRTRWQAEVSLAACVAVSATLHVVTFSRMAIVEPTGVAASLAALWLWIRYPGRAGACVASVALAACAMFFKVSFVFTPGVVALLWLADAVASRHEPEKSHASTWLAWSRQARALVLAVAWIGAAAVAAMLGVRSWAGRDWFEMQAVAVYEQTGTAGPLASLIYQLESVEEFLLEDPERLVLLAAAALMLPALLLPWSARGARPLVAGRAYLAMALWMAAGFVLYSAFEYRVPRYYYFLIFPLTFLALEGVTALFCRRRARIAAAVLALHLAVQVPDWGRWLDRGSSSSQADMARAVTARITGGGEPPVLLGLNAAFVALFDPRVRPLELEFVDPEVLCRRIEWWRPAYFLLYDSQFPDYEPLCPGLVRELRPLEYHTVMGRWYYDSDVVLARLVYDRPGASRGPRSTMSEKSE